MMIGDVLRPWLAISTAATNHHEVTLVEMRFDFDKIEARLEILIGGRAYNSNKLHEERREDSIASWFGGNTTTGIFPALPGYHPWQFCKSSSGTGSGNRP